MPREQADWYAKQSLSDDDGGDNRIHARQCCAYYSTVNVNKANYPYSSSFEQEQTWTLTRTMSNHNKRYQSSIENIHLTIPSVFMIITPFSSNANHHNYENEKIKIDRAVSLLPPLPPSRQHSLLSHRLNRTNMDSKVHQQEISRSSNSSLKTNSIMKKSRPIANTMRIMHVNGEFVVRI
jgi:hypothetical protein